MVKSYIDSISTHIIIIIIIIITITIIIIVIIIISHTTVKNTIDIYFSFTYMEEMESV